MSAKHDGPSNIIAFPVRPRGGLSEVEILHGTLSTLLNRIEALDELDHDTARCLATTFRTVVGWLEERHPE